MEWFGASAPTAGTGAHVSALDTFTTESSLDFGRGAVEVRQYSWLRDTDDTWTSDSYFLHICLTPRPRPASATFLDGGPRGSETIGRILFVPPGVTVRSGGPLGRQRSLQCALSREMVEGLLPQPPSWDSAALREGLHLTGPEIEWLLLKMHRELREAGFAANVVIESLANTLAVALIRRFGMERSGPRHNIGGLAPWRMRLIRERVQADKPVCGLQELADLCGMSVRHLSRAFKAETGTTLAKYVEEAMVERARLMLRDSDAPIAEIAQALGFSSAGSFAYAFRRATGLRPSDIEGRRRGAAALERLDA
jgi:AraC family transcriptional regulator